MRRIVVSFLVCGCFSEPIVDKTASTTVVAPMESSGEESSSSSAGESSSSEDSGSSSTTEVDPLECPEWCNNGCDEVLGVFVECRCVIDHDCEPGGLTCDREPEASSGHCR